MNFDIRSAHEPPGYLTEQAISLYKFAMIFFKKKDSIYI